MTPGAGYEASFSPPCGVSEGRRAQHLALNYSAHGFVAQTTPGAVEAWVLPLQQGTSH